MISKKMKILAENSSPIRAMFMEGANLASIYGQENIYDFSLGNPSVEAPAIVKEAIIEELSNTKPIDIHSYTPNAGIKDVRQFVASALNTEFETTFTHESVTLTSGAAGGLNIIFKTLLNPDDEVITFAPYFAEYKAYVSNYDGKLVVSNCDLNTFLPDMEAFKNSINEKTKAVIINSPNNPTGVIYSLDVIKNISAILEQKQKEFNTAIYLISDEPYRKIAYDNAIVPFISKYYKNTFVVNSFSKSLSLPGERIGFVIANENMDGFEEITFALEVANRVMGFVNAPSLFQRILPKCFNENTDVLAYKKNRDLLYNMLIELGFDCIKPEGAFYLFPKALIDNDIEFCNIAKGKDIRILSAPGSAFGCPGFFRLSYCVSIKTIENSYESFKKLAESFS